MKQNRNQSLKHLNSQPFAKKKLPKNHKCQYSFNNQSNSPTVKLYLHNQPNLPQKPIQFHITSGLSFNQLKINLNKKLSGHPGIKHKIIGFETLGKDHSFDYRLQRGLGILNKNLEIKCLFEAVEKQGIEKYQICTCLAVGGFSKVFLVRSMIDGEFYAAKFIERDKSSPRHSNLLENQKNIGSSIQHPFMVKTHEFIETQKFHILILDYCPGGELFYLLKQRKRLSEQQAKFCFIQILLGLEQLHRKQIMFRDLKPENIMLDADGHLKITDFGLAKSCRIKSYSFCGSLEYMAPEIIIGKGHSKEIDYYCLGALLYEMLMGYPPFYLHGSHPNQTKYRIIEEEVVFPETQELSGEVKDLISKLLNKNYKLRLGSLGGSKQIFCHPWIGRLKRENYLLKELKSPFEVDLTKSNFDPQEIGQSERVFHEKIEKELQQLRKSKSKNKSLKTQTKKLSSTHSQKLCNPYKQRSSFNSSTKYVKTKSPYQLQSRNNLHVIQQKYKTIKTESTQSKIKKPRFLQMIRFTQNNENYNSPKKVPTRSNKIKRKCKNDHKNSKLFRCQ